LAGTDAQHMNGPVKVIWSREEGIQHDMYRPAYYDRVMVGLDGAGKPIAWITVSRVPRWWPATYRRSRCLRICDANVAFFG